MPNDFSKVLAEIIKLASTLPADPAEYGKFSAPKRRAMRRELEGVVMRLNTVVQLLDLTRQPKHVFDPTSPRIIGEMVARTLLLQDKEPLDRLLAELKSIDSQMPLFVKIAPDLTLGQVDDVIDVVQKNKLTGIVATNTTLSREGLTADPHQDGGLSGAPLTLLSDGCLEYIRSQADASLVLIGVGGIMCVEDANRKIELGADLVQTYTGWIYGGPNFVSEIVTQLNP